MISDEMRELLSAYVDGELPHTDAARVEDTAKRDPRLRRHIHAYRRLRDTLQVWDAEENQLEPSGRVRMRALSRVQALVAEREAEQQERRRRFFGGGWFQQPMSLAAGVLIAVTAGVLASFMGGEREGPTFAVRSDALPMEPVAAYGDFATPVDTSPLDVFSGDAQRWEEGALDRVIRNESEGILIEQDGEFVRWSRRAIEADRLIRNIDRHPDGRRVDIRETKTGEQPNVMVASWMRGAQAVRTPYEGVVALRLGAAKGTVPATRAVPARTEDDSRWVQAGELNDLHDIRVTKGAAVLTVAGELWVEPVEGGKPGEVGRARVVTATTWIKRGELVSMAWANETAADPSAHKQWALRAESIVLGPKARRVLINKSGRDQDVLEWMLATYGAEGVVSSARTTVAKHRLVIDRMVRALERDTGATGFAVYDSKNRVLGTELFATHDLMVEFAPRMLAGYMLEADGRVRLDKKSGGAAEVEAAAQEFLSDVLPRQVKRVVSVRDARNADDWPEGMRQVNLQTPSGSVVGHGLMVGDQPLHLSLFGE